MFFKNCSYSLFFIVLFLLSTSINGMVYKILPKPTPSIDKKLDLIALDYEYGYKAANLTILKDVTTQFNITHQLPITLEVPNFCPIPSHTIENFIKQHTSIDITQEWERIITTFFPNEETKNKTITDKQFPDGFLTECSLLEKKIKEEVAAIHITDTLGTAFNTKELDTIIQNAATKEKRLMVRSSGKEDTKELANAGGNVTQANVIPKTEYIIKALAEVVASYFSSKSLTQRLGAQDRSLFDLNPLTPVIIQRMIHNAQGIPTKCGVMFTEETEGGIAQYNHKNNDGLTETTGITVIQAAYGHNEGVVNSLVPVDTYYATADKKIFTVIRPKTYRMAPTEKSGELELQKNNADIIDAPALNTETVKALKLFATELERTYGHPMDVEFVINEDEKKIYIVQARPLVYDTTTLPASYIINPDLLDAQKFIGSAIGVAGGALRYCTSAQEIIIANTINQALLLYQKNIHGLKKESVQCILIGEMAPRTSHEATTFRSENKPVICLKEYQGVAQLLKDNSNISIIISPQQGLIANFGDQATSIDQLIKDHIATLGWTCYPIDRLLSLNNEFNPHLSLTDKAIQKLFAHVINDQQLNTIKEKISFLSLADLGHTWKKALHTIKTGSMEEACVALAVLLYEIRTIIEQSSKNMELDEDLQNKTALLQSYLLYCAQNIQTNLHIPPTDLRYTQRLFAIQILESILYQQPLFNEIIDGYSVTTVVAKELLVEQKIVQQAQATNQPLDDLSVQFIKIKSFAFSPATEEQWTNFINQLALPENIENRKTFSFLIKQLATLNILPIWLNTAFAEKAAKSTNTELITTSLLAEYITQKNFLDIIAEKRDIITALNKQAFANPKTFHTQWQTFNENVLKYFLSQEFLTAFIRANALGQLAALETMNQLIEAFDESIKAVTGSTDYSNDETKVENFYSMLTQDMKLFKKWINIVPPGIIQYREHEDAQFYFDILEIALKKNKLSATENLKASPTFNAIPFTIGSTADIRQYDIDPKTYEDIFTTIHQSLLVIIQALYKSNDYVKKATLPPLLENIAKQIEQVRDVGLIGINFLPASIQLTYNYSLRQHSMQMIVTYYKKTNSINVFFKIYGLNESDRWDKINYFVNAASTHLPIQVKNVVITDTMYSFSLDISQEIDNNKLTEIIYIIAHYSIASSAHSNKTSIRLHNYFKLNKLKRVDLNQENTVNNALIYLQFLVDANIDRKEYEEDITHWCIKALDQITEENVITLLKKIKKLYNNNFINETVLNKICFLLLQDNVKIVSATYHFFIPAVTYEHLLWNLKINIPFLIQKLTEIGKYIIDTKDASYEIAKYQINIINKLLNNYLKDKEFKNVSTIDFSSSLKHVDQYINKQRSSQLSGISLEELIEIYNANKIQEKLYSQLNTPYPTNIITTIKNSFNWITSLFNNFFYSQPAQ